MGTRANAVRAALLLALYALAVAAPVALARLVSGPSDEGLVVELGRSCALVAFCVLALQPVLSARLRWAERPFGLDRLYRFHKIMAVVATGLLLAHPTLLSLGFGSPKLLVSLQLPWFVYLGKATLLVLLLVAVTALFRRGLRLEFERWRAVHNATAVAVLLGGFTHSLAAGEDLRHGPMRFVWTLVLAGGLATYVYHTVRTRASRAAYSVAEVSPETHNVWTLTLGPLAGRPPLRHLPGQFAFLALHRPRGLATEEHPFTISASPTGDGLLRFTIKASGDYTATIGDTRPGDSASVDGPFGRFSPLLHPEESDLVLVAGGIGITPFLSVLRAMRDTGARGTVLLLYGNRGEADIVCRDELDRLAARLPWLTVVHVLSRPGPGWGGEAGHIDCERIARLCGEGLRQKAFYVCGPPAMAQSVLRALRQLGVPRARRHHEYFAL